MKLETREQWDKFKVSIYYVEQILKDTSLEEYIKLPEEVKVRLKSIHNILDFLTSI